MPIYNIGEILHFRERGKIMANILQVTPSPVQTDNRTLPTGQEAKNQVQNPRIHNPVDPTRVVRADGQQGGRTGTATGEGSPGILDYDSNYGAFVQKLSNNPSAAGLLEQIIFQDTAGMPADQAQMVQLLKELTASLQMQSGEDLLNFIMEQGAAQVKYSGAFFDGLRNILTQNTSDGLKEAVLEFLKSYNDFSAGPHLLTQMRTLTDQIHDQLLTPFREEFRQEIAQMNWYAANGDTEGNAQALNGRIIPFLSNYISRTHDYGAVRDSVMLFILNAVKYENGSQDGMMKLFQRLVGNRDFSYFYKGDAQADLNSTLEAMHRSQAGNKFTDALASLLERGGRGEAGVEQMLQFQSITQNILLNESVYMPLIHLFLPFSYEDKEVMSEIWIDPDAGEDGEEGGRKIRMLLQFQIQRLGSFDMVLEFQGWNVNMQLGVPPVLQNEFDTIREKVSDILKDNGMKPGRMTVAEKRGELRLESVFPEIREKERTVNVRI